MSEKSCVSFWAIVGRKNRAGAGALWLDTSKLAPGDYALELNGAKAVERFTLTRPLRKSAGSVQDEVLPSAAMSGDDASRILQS